AAGATLPVAAPARAAAEATSAAAGPARAAARHAARAEEPAPRRRRAGCTPSEPAPAARAPAPAEELVQHPGEVLGLRVLDVVDERLPPRPLLGRDVEQAEPVLDLVEQGPVEGHRDQRVEPREGHDVDAALALAGRRDAVGRA